MGLRIKLLVIVLCVSLAGCETGEDHTIPDNMQVIINSDGSSQITPIVINDLPCLVAVRGNVFDAIAKFENSCGLTKVRECNEVRNGVFQCTNGVELAPTEILPKGAVKSIVVEEVITTIDEPVTSTMEPNIEDDGEATYVPPTPVAQINVVTNAVDSCKTDGLSNEKAWEILGKVCLKNNFSSITCDSETLQWTCSNGPVEVGEQIVKIPTPIIKTAPKRAPPKKVPEQKIRDLIVDFGDITVENIISTGDIWADHITSEDGKIWVNGFSDNVATVIEYIDDAYPEIDTRLINVAAVHNKNNEGTSAYNIIMNLAVYLRTIDPDATIASNAQ